MSLKSLCPALFCLFLLCVCAPSDDTSPSNHIPPSVSDFDASSVQEDVSIPQILVIPPEKDEFVCVADFIPDIIVDLKYATDENFTGEIIYSFTDAYLRYSTVKKLSAVADAVAKDGYRLVIWDAFRPVSAQFKLWEICPDPVYVANPNKGFSSHSRGNTVDITLAYEDGNLVEMPTGFDDFTTLADRDYQDVPEAAANAKYLESVMLEYGFKPYSGEWWHFSDIDSYEVSTEFNPSSLLINARIPQKIPCETFARDFHSYLYNQYTVCFL